MPTAPEIEKFITSPLFRTISTIQSGNTHKIMEEAHKKAHGMIANNDTYKALLLLLAAGSLAVNEI